MNLYLVPVTQGNREQVEQLQVYPEQVDNIESVSECLMEADELEVWKTVGIYDGDILVGFAMYGLFQDVPGGQVWLDRFLIDRNFQGRGYGKATIHLLLSKLLLEFGKNRIYLSVYADNQKAIRLYESIGFYFNGEYDTNGEKVMVYDFKAVNWDDVKNGSYLIL